MVTLILIIFGLVVGSFLNVLILRIPERRSIGGRSYCPACRRTLRWFELIPVVSYVVLRGRCRTCLAPISIQYPLVELVTAALFVFAYWYHFQFSISGEAGPGSAGPYFVLAIFVRDIILLCAFLVLFVQDLRFQILPDHITLPAIAVAIVFWFIQPFNSQLLIYNSLAVAVGTLFFLLQWLVSRGRWVGGGDIRLGAVMGALLGWPGVAVALFFAYVGGSFILLPLLLTGRVGRKQQVPFGIFLIPATVITLYAGEWLLQQYYFYLGI